MLKRVRLFVVVAVIGTFGSGLLACGGDDDPDDVVDEPDAGEDTLLEPPPEGEGYQFTMKTQLEPSSEVEHCMFVKGPAEGMLINHDLVRYSTGSHHVILYETPYTAIPTAKNDGTPVDTSGVFDCTDGASNGWSISRVVGGSQNASGDPGILFPPDVAIRIQPDAILMINAHYINASSEPLEPEVFINVYTITEEELRVEGDLLFLYNPLIKASMNERSRARMRCPVHEDITVKTMQSHMHARGVDYAAMLMGDEPFYTNTKWEDVPVKVFEGEGMQISAGSYLDYWCEYANGEDHDIYQGPRSSDEMCMMLGAFWPANQNIANCLPESGQGFAGEWVGNGTATCAQTLECMRDVIMGPAAEQRITECIYDADPTVASEASVALLCLAQVQDPSVNCNDAIIACEGM